VLAPHSPLRSAVSVLAQAATTSPPAPSPELTAELAHCRAARYAWALLLARIYEALPTALPALRRRDADHRLHHRGAGSATDPLLSAGTQ